MQSTPLRLHFLICASSKKFEKRKKDSYSTSCQMFPESSQSSNILISRFWTRAIKSSSGDWDWLLMQSNYSNLMIFSILAFKIMNISMNFYYNDRFKFWKANILFNIFMNSRTSLIFWYEKTFCCFQLKSFRQSSYLKIAPSDDIYDHDSDTSCVKSS